MKTKKLFIVVMLLIAVLSMGFLTACDDDQPDPLDGVLIASVAIKTPAQTSFALGEAFNCSALELEAVYVNGQRRVFDSSGVSVDSTQFDNTTDGFYDIFLTLIVSGHQLSYTVVVGNPVVSPVSMTVASIPTKIKYYLGESFDPSGLVVRAKNNDKSVVTLDATDYTIDSSSFNPIATGIYNIDVTLNADPSIKTSFMVYVEKEAQAIAVRVLPKTEFFIGSSFNHSGLIVEVTFVDGSKSDLSSGAYDVDYSDFEIKKNSVGTANILIYLKDKPLITTSYTTTFFDASSISVVGRPYRNTYAIGETGLNFSGIGVYASFGTQGYTAALSSDRFSIDSSQYNKNVVGSYTMIVRYNANTSLTATFDIFVEDISAISVYTSPKKIQYLMGESFNSEGLSIMATFANGEKGVLPPSYYSLDASSYNTSIAGPYGIGVKLVSNTLISCSFLVSVFEADSIHISPTSMHQNVFNYAEHFHHYGLEIEAEYGGGFTTILNPSTYTVLSHSYKRIASGNYHIMVVLNANPSLVCEYFVQVLPRLPDTILRLQIGTYAPSAHETMFANGESFSAQGLRVYGSTSESEKEAKTRRLSPSEYTVDDSAYNPLVAGSYPIDIYLNSNPTVRTTYYVTVANAGEVVISFRSMFTDSGYLTQYSFACQPTDILNDVLVANRSPYLYNGYSFLEYCADQNYSIPLNLTQTVASYSSIISNNKFVVYVRYEMDANNVSQIYNNTYNYYTNFYSTYAIINEYSEDLTFLDYYKFTPATTATYAVGGLGISSYSGGLTGYAPIRIFEYSGNQKEPIDLSKEVSCWDGDNVYKGFSLTAGKTYIVVLMTEIIESYGMPFTMNQAITVTINLSATVEAELGMSTISVIIPQASQADSVILDVFGSAAEDLGGRFELYSDAAMSNQINYAEQIMTSATYYMDFLS